jgi:hypothetical protein
LNQKLNPFPIIIEKETIAMKSGVCQLANKNLNQKAQQKLLLFRKVFYFILNYSLKVSTLSCSSKAITLSLWFELFFKGIHPLLQRGSDPVLDPCTGENATPLSEEDGMDMDNRYY